MIMNKKNLVVIGWLVVSTMMSAQSVYPRSASGKNEKRDSGSNSGTEF